MISCLDSMNGQLKKRTDQNFNIVSSQFLKLNNHGYDYVHPNCAGGRG
jgi:hypothetical protein